MSPSTQIDKEHPMSRWTRRAAIALTFGLAMAATPASAEPAGSSGFGQHVRQCAQSMGFDQAHHPGLHRGITGWHQGHGC